MATITINIPVDKETWVLDGFKTRFDYQEQVTNPDFDMDLPVDSETNPMTIANPETVVEFAKRMIIFMIKDAACSGHNQVDMETNAVEVNTIELT